VDARNLHVKGKEDDDEINSFTARSENLVRSVAGVGLFKKAFPCELPELLPEIFGLGKEQNVEN
jgi:hypothetical protein